MHDDLQRLRVIYHGRVQGVGFRYTTDRIARGFAVTGTVRNQADGTVELIVAGESRDVREFLSAIADRFDGNITQTKETTLNETAAVPDGFSIRY